MVKQLTDEHKEALAVGREQAKVVRDYLDALKAHKPRRGPKPNAEKLRKQLEEIEADLANEDISPARRLMLLQERIDKNVQLSQLHDTDNFQELEDAFKSVAADYAARKGITYAAFREMGVPAATLREAGINR